MIEYVAETGSTSADLATRLWEAQFVPEGHWLVTDRQVAGRGRHGREWLDGAGNFMGSTIVHLRHGDPEPSSLALLVGLAVREAVAGRGTEAVLKWPNDVMVGQAKLAGILLERVADSVVVGIGVNLAAAPDVLGRETAALDRPADRDRFAEDLARLLDLELDRWRSFGVGPIARRWMAVGHPIGTPLVVGETALAGAFAGLDDNGALQLRLLDGTTRTVHAGEVHFAVSATKD